MTRKDDLPESLLYNKDYSWVRIEKDEAVLGITKPSADKVQEFVFVDLPETGKKIEKGDTYVSLEAMKWSGHLESPLSGEIVEVNEDLFENPGIIQQDPYGKGWIARIKMSNSEEKKSLMTAEEIKENN